MLLGIGLLISLPFTVVLSWRNAFRQKFAIGVHAFIILTVLDRTRKGTLQREPLEVALLTFPGISLGGMVGVLLYVLAPLSSTADWQTKQYLKSAGTSLGHALRASAALFDVEAMVQAAGRHNGPEASLNSAGCTAHRVEHSPLPHSSSATCGKPGSSAASAGMPDSESLPQDNALVAALDPNTSTSASPCAFFRGTVDSAVLDARIASKPLLRFVRNEHIEQAKDSISRASVTLKHTAWELPAAVHSIRSGCRWCCRCNFAGEGKCLPWHCSSDSDCRGHEELYKTEKKWMYVLAQLKYMSYLTHTATEKIAGTSTHLTAVSALAPHISNAARLTTRVLSSSMATEMSHSGWLLAVTGGKRSSINRVWRKLGVPRRKALQGGHNVQQIAELKKELEYQCGQLLRQLSLVQPILADTGSEASIPPKSMEHAHPQAEQNTDLLALSSIVFGSIRSAQLTLRAAFMPGGVGSSLDPEDVMPSLRHVAPAAAKHAGDGNSKPGQGSTSSPPAEVPSDEAPPEECGPEAGPSHDAELHESQPQSRSLSMSGSSDNSANRGRDLPKSGAASNLNQKNLQEKRSGCCPALFCSTETFCLPHSCKAVCMASLLNRFAWQRALKLTLAVMAASLLLLLDSGMEFAVLAPLAVAFAAGANAGNTFATGYRRLAGTVLGSLAGFFIVELSFNKALPLILLLSLSTGTIGVLNSIAKNERQAIANITGFTVVLVTLFVDLSQPVAATGNLALARIEQNVIGVLLLLLLSAVVFPYRKLTELPKHISRGLFDMDVACEQTFQLLSATIGVQTNRSAHGRNTMYGQGPSRPGEADWCAAERGRPSAEMAEQHAYEHVADAFDQVQLGVTGLQHAASAPPGELYAEPHNLALQTDKACSPPPHARQLPTIEKRQAFMSRALYLRLYYAGIPAPNSRVQGILEAADAEIADAHREAVFERRLFPRRSYKALTQAMHNFMQHLRQVNQFRMSIALQRAHLFHSQVLTFGGETQQGSQGNPELQSNQEHREELEFSTLQSACRQLLLKLDEKGCIGISAALGLNTQRFPGFKSPRSASSPRTGATQTTRRVTEDRQITFASVLPVMRELFSTLQQCCSLLAAVLDSSRQDRYSTQTKGNSDKSEPETGSNKAAGQLEPLSVAGAALQKVQLRLQRSIAQANLQAARQLSSWLASVAEHKSNSQIHAALFSGSETQGAASAVISDMCPRSYSNSVGERLQQPARPRTMLMHSMLRANAESVYFSSLGLELGLLGDCMQRILLHGSDIFVQNGQMDYSSKLLGPLRNDKGFTLDIQNNMRDGPTPMYACVPTTLQACVARGGKRRETRPPPASDVLCAVEGTSEAIHTAAIQLAAMQRRN